MEYLWKKILNMLANHESKLYSESVITKELLGMKVLKK